MSNFSQRTIKPAIRPIVTSKVSDQSVHPLSKARVLVYPSLDSPEALEDMRSAKTLIRQRSLIRVFAGRTRLIVGFVVRWLIY